MEIHVTDEVRIDYDYDPGENGTRVNGVQIMQHIPESVQINGISVLGVELSQATWLAILSETKGKIEELCLEDVKAQQEYAAI